MPKNLSVGNEPFDLLSAADAPAPRLPAWLLSCLLHALLVFLLAALVRTPAAGVIPEADRSAGIVLAQASGQHTRFHSEADQQQTAQQAASSAATSSRDQLAAESALPSASQMPVDVGQMLPDRDSLAGVGTGEAWATMLPSAGQLTGGPGPSRSIGKGNNTYLFGLEGQGSLFVYVFDRSDSMNGFQGRPLAAAKAELIQSIRMLASTQQFQVIFYNHDVTVFNPNPSLAPRLMFADDGTKDLAEQFIRALPATGGTEHIEALRRALLLGPDVIFFLTDAEDPQLTARQLEQLRRLNRGSVIHAIEFGTGPPSGGDNFLMRLARQNNGQHTYVDVTRLPARRD
jgi:hypothetical protein